MRDSTTIAREAELNVPTRIESSVLLADEATTMHEVYKSERVAELVRGIKFKTFVDALRDVAESHGEGAYVSFSLTFYADEYEQIKDWIAKHGKEKFNKQILCLTAEAK
jgi:hypothetical protein